MSNQNQVTLIGYYGGDKTHSLAAWSSTYLELGLEIPDNIEDRVDVIIDNILSRNKKIRNISQLLSYLGENGHHSPFEFSTLHFITTEDYKSHIHSIKHRIGHSKNSECLTGDSVITFLNINNNSSSKLRVKLKDLYYKWNNGRSHQATEKDALYSQRRIMQRRLRVLDESTGLFTYSHIKDIWYKGVQKVYEIKLANGKSIKCTNNHKIYTKNGFKTINDGLVVGDLVGVNGVNIEVANKPWTFKSFFDGSENYTRREFATMKNLKIELVKKWGYIFNIIFKKDENKGRTPWNKGLTNAYKINIGNRAHNPRKGANSHFWRGGITSERAKITVWTNKQARKIHEKYNFTCQKCGNGGFLHTHHIIPVSIDINKAYDIDNLITVCKVCHSEIHSSRDSEIAFAEKVLANDFLPYAYEWGKDKRANKPTLSVHFSKIVSIEFSGYEETYDLEVEGINNNFVANGIVVHNSSRYKERTEDKFYLPEDWDNIIFDRTNSGTCYDGGDYIYLPDGALVELIFEGGEDWKGILRKYTAIGNILYHEAIKQLTPRLGKARAKESAAYFLTLNNQVNTNDMWNFRSFMEFQRLRNSPHAQKEIRDIAEMMLEQVRNINGNPFEYSLKAFGL